MDQDKIKKLQNISDITKRRLYLVGLISQSLGSLKPVLVGGCALEFYSLGGYSTGDVDVVYPDNKELDSLLLDLGFVKDGRCWVNEDLNLIFEAPGSELSPQEAERVVKVSIEGLDVTIISIEDLIIDRLNAAVHWKSSDDGLWAKELYVMYKDKLDIDYLSKRTEEEKTREALDKMISEANDDN